MSLRGRSFRTRGHNGRLRSHPTLLIAFNYHTVSNSRGVTRFWRMIRYFL